MSINYFRNSFERAKKLNASLPAVAGRFVLLALLADTEEAVIVKNQFEAMFLSDTVLNLLNLVTMKLNHRAAPNADHVVVMPFAGHALKKFALPFPDRLLNHTALKKKRKRPVDGIP